MDYAELHLHTEKSLMDGVSTAEEYCKRAEEIGITTLGVTDHSTCAAHREFLRTCTEHNIKAILGVEAHFAIDRFDRRTKAKRQDGEDSELYYHLILLAKNDNGLKNIYKMEQAAWNESFYNKPLIGFDLLEKYHEDVIMTTACVSGPLARNIINEKEDYALEFLNKFKDIFSNDLYVELQTHNEGISPGLNHKLIKMADDNGVKAISTNDCHMASPKDLWLQESILILNTSPKKNPAPDKDILKDGEYIEKLNTLYPERKMTFEHAEIYLASPEFRYQQFIDQGIDRPDLFSNTIEVADKIG